MPVGDLSAFNISRHGQFTVYTRPEINPHKKSTIGQDCNLQCSFSRSGTHTIVQRRLSLTHTIIQSTINLKTVIIFYVVGVLMCRYKNINPTHLLRLPFHLEYTVQSYLTLSNVFFQFYPSLKLYHHYYLNNKSIHLNF